MVAKKRLGEMLLEAGVIDETQLLSALGHQRKWGGKLGQALVELHLATEGQIVAALAKKFGYDVVNVSGLRPSPLLEGALRLVPRELALRHTLLPIASDTSTLTLAMGDPSNVAVIDEISFRTGRRVKVALAGDREIAAAVRRLYYADEERPREAIPLEEASPDGPLETTRDPFAAMPDHIREGYFNRPAHTVDAPEAPRAPGPAAPQRRAPPPATPGAQAWPTPAAVPPRAPARSPGPVHDSPDLTPPPMLPRSERPAVAPWPELAAPAPSAAPEGDDMGEPVLATDLLVDDEGPVEGPPPERERSPKEAALLDALDRLARGEESATVKPGRLAAALARVLLQRGLITAAELLEALARK